jgi:hypothetical protein
VTDETEPPIPLGSWEVVTTTTDGYIECGRVYRLVGWDPGAITTQENVWAVEHPNGKPWSDGQLGSRWPRTRMLGGHHPSARWVDGEANAVRLATPEEVSAYQLDQLAEGGL